MRHHKCSLPRVSFGTGTAVPCCALLCPAVPSCALLCPLVPKLRQCGLCFGGSSLIDGIPEGVLQVLIRMKPHGASIMVHCQTLESVAPLLWEYAAKPAERPRPFTFTPAPTAKFHNKNFHTKKLWVKFPEESPMK